MNKTDDMLDFLTNSSVSMLVTSLMKDLSLLHSVVAYVSGIEES